MDFLSGPHIQGELSLERTHKGETGADRPQLFPDSGDRSRCLGGWILSLVGNWGQSQALSLNWLGSDFHEERTHVPQNCAQVDVNCLFRQARRSRPSLASTTLVFAPHGCSLLHPKYPKQKDNTCSAPWASGRSRMHKTTTRAGEKRGGRWEEKNEYNQEWETRLPRMIPNKVHHHGMKWPQMK